MSIRIATLLLLLPLQSGCVARTALDVVTAPVKVASKSVDMLTTSRSEADEKRGRAMRQREERIGKLERQLIKLEQRCDEGHDQACQDRLIVEQQMQFALEQPN